MFFNDKAESLLMDAPDRDRNRENDDCKCHPNEFEYCYIETARSEPSLQI